MGNWALTLPPLAALNPFDPTRSRIPTGFYSVLINDTDDHVAKDAPQGSPATTIKFTCTITEEGDVKGRSIELYMSKNMKKQDGTDNETVQRNWKNLLMAIGAQNAQLGQQLPIGPSTFNGRTAYVFIETPPEGEKDASGNNKGDRKSFVTQDMYQKGKQLAAANKAAATASPAVASAPVPQVGAPVGFAASAPALASVIPQPLQNGVAQLGQALGAGGGVPVPAAGGVQF